MIRQQTLHPGAHVVEFRLKLRHAFNPHIQFMMNVLDLIVDCGEFVQTGVRYCPSGACVAFRSGLAGFPCRAFEAALAFGSAWSCRPGGPGGPEMPREPRSPRCCFAIRFLFLRGATGMMTP